MNFEDLKKQMLDMQDRLYLAESITLLSLDAFNLTEKVLKLLEEKRELRECLEYYGERTIVRTGVPVSEMFIDHGSKARELLERIKE